jgi:hypothetical protein
LSTVRCFLAEDSEILRILADKGRTGITVRIALGDPDGPSIAERGEEEGISDATASKIRDALTLYLPLCTGGTSRSGSIEPSCTTRSTVQMTRSSLISMSIASRLSTRRSSA